MIFFSQVLLVTFIGILLLDVRLAAKIKKEIKKDPLVVLITGCSTGIGKSTALEFAKDENFIVWATMRSPDKWDIEPKDNIKVAQLDVTSDESVTSLVDRIISEDKKIDIVVNNAGYGVAGTLEQVKIEEAKDVFEVNVWGVVRLLQAVLPFMRERRAGQIINISSTSGMRGIPCFEFYTGSKFALEGITDSMRYSLAPYDISVTNVNAGPVRTSFTDRFGNVEQGGKGSRQLSEQGDSDFLLSFTERMIGGLNLRMQSPEAQTSEEVAQIVVNLAHIKQKMKRLTDVPFNIGTSADSQQIVEEVRRNPTGWGGIYNEILQKMPSLPPKKRSKKKHEEL